MTLDPVNPLDLPDLPRPGPPNNDEFAFISLGYVVTFFGVGCLAFLSACFVAALLAPLFKGERNAEGILGIALWALTLAFTVAAYWFFWDPYLAYVSDRLGQWIANLLVIGLMGYVVIGGAILALVVAWNLTIRPVVWFFSQTLDRGFFAVATQAIGNLAIVVVAIVLPALIGFHVVNDRWVADDPNYVVLVLQGLGVALACHVAVAVSIVAIVHQRR
ncbi:MAG: hypothetical protein R3C31_15065 [Hyphomonadaceae bacterium]